MKSKEALIYVKMCCSDGLQLPQNQSLEQVKLIGASIETIEKELERLEELQEGKNKFRELYEIEKHDKLVLKWEKEDLENENQKLKEIIKDNFDCYKESKKVFFTYTEPVMEKEILEVLENDK